MEIILNDGSKFTKLDCDPLDLCQKRENRLIRFLRDSLLKNKAIPQDVYRELFTSGSTPGILYGLPKVHKPDCPARPILSAIGTYNYKIAKFLVPILQPFTSGPYTVKDSFSFVKEITSFHTDSDCVMASFDVSSLFTNVPLNECVNICCDLLFKDSDLISFNECKFTREQFHKLLNLAVKDNHFIFNGQLYEQIDGVAMGSPLGPSLTNIFMCSLEHKFLDNCPSDCKPILYRRFVDDTFCIFRNKQQVDKFLSHINSSHGNITFTAEISTDNKLPFLDTLVTFNNNSFSTDLYRKKTFTGLYSDFASLSPHIYKVNLVRSLIFRAFNICSSYLSFHIELSRIKGILKENSFPMPLIDKVIKSFLDSIFSNKSKETIVTDSKPFLFFSTPFLGSGSLHLKSKLSRLIKQCYPGYKLRVVFSTPRRLSNFFPFKDSIPKLLRSSVVYCYKCPSCNARYYGKTSRNLAIRCREHIGVTKTGSSVNNNSSAIYNHSSTTGHPVSPEDFSIISSTSNNSDLLIHESLLILRDRPSLNSQTSSIQLTLF